MKGPAKGRVQQVGDALAVVAIVDLRGAQSVVRVQFRLGQRLRAEPHVPDHAPVLGLLKAALGQQTLAQCIVFVGIDVEVQVVAVAHGPAQVCLGPVDHLAFQMAIVGVDVEMRVAAAFGQNETDQPAAAGFPKLRRARQQAVLLAVFVVKALAVQPAHVPVQPNRRDWDRLDQQAAHTPEVLVVAHRAGGDSAIAWNCGCSHG